MDFCAPTLHDQQTCFHTRRSHSPLLQLRHLISLYKKWHSTSHRTVMHGKCNHKPTNISTRPLQMTLLGPRILTCGFLASGLCGSRGALTPSERGTCPGPIAVTSIITLVGTQGVLALINSIAFVSAWATCKVGKEGHGIRELRGRGR